LDRRRRRLYQDGLDVPLLRDASRVPRRRAEARRPGRIRPGCRQGAAANERARSSAIVKRQGQLWQTGAALFSRHCHRARARLRTRSQEILVPFNEWSDHEFTTPSKMNNVISENRAVSESPDFRTSQVGLAFLADWKNVYLLYILHTLNKSLYQATSEKRPKAAHRAVHDAERAVCNVSAPAPRRS